MFIKASINIIVINSFNGDSICLKEIHFLLIKGLEDHQANHTEIFSQ